LSPESGTEFIASSIAARIKEWERQSAVMKAAGRQSQSDEDCLKMQQWAAVINKNSVEGYSGKKKKNRGSGETERVKVAQQ